MKPFLLSILFGFLGLSTFGQVEGDPMKFMGVSMDLPTKTFISKLRDKGLKKISSTGMYLLKGTFASFSDCTIGVKPDENDKNKIEAAIVMLPGIDDWDTLYNIYSTFKKMLYIKYGAPTNEKEEFQSHSEPTTNSERMHELRIGRCKYKTDYFLSNGTINLYISTDHNDYGTIKMTYFPSHDKRTKLDNILDDL